jgi:ribose-phosphate pyrophosphokinase
MTSKPAFLGELAVFTGRANPRLAQAIAKHLDIDLSPLIVTSFPDQEIAVRIDVSVRGKDVFIIQPTSPPAHASLVELLIILDAIRRASPARITAVIPYYGYARQDKKTAGREPITARLVADMITSAGADRVLTVDLHSPQIQGFFNIPVDQLTAVPVLSDYISSWHLADTVVVTPDAGRVNMATEYANRLGVPVVIIHKRRITGESTEVAHIVGDVRGKRPIIIDDMITTGGTIHRSVEALITHGALPEVFIAASHGVLVGKALELLSNPAICQIAVTDSVLIEPVKQIEKLHTVSIASLLAGAITRIHDNSSVSEMFE